MLYILTYDRPFRPTQQLGLSQPKNIGPSLKSARLRRFICMTLVNYTLDWYNSNFWVSSAQNDRNTTKRETGVA